MNNKLFHATPDHVNALHNRAAYALARPDGSIYTTKNGQRTPTFSTRDAAEDYLLDLAEVIPGARLSIVVLG